MRKWAVLGLVSAAVLTAVVDVKAKKKKKKKDPRAHTSIIFHDIVVGRGEKKGPC